tara:strand:+ start:1075 stop:2046 length:972 start_codon:yes stop_codon:yes gene_type:complete
MKRIVIYGLGSIGCKHFNLIRKYFPNVEIGVIRSGNGLMNNESCKADQYFKNSKEALNWPAEAAIISSPASYHFDHSIAFIKNGLTTLIEKPLDLDFANLKRWDNLEKLSKNSKILVGYVLRHDPAIKYIKNWLKNKSIGELINVQMVNSSWLPSWRENINYKNSVSAIKSLGGGVLLEQSHDINLASSLFGELKVKNVILRNTGQLELDVEDFAKMNFVDKNNMPINIHIDFCSRTLIREILIRGSAGFIKWDIAKGILSLQKESVGIENHNFSNDPHKRLLIQLKHLVDIFEDKDKPLVSLNDGLKTLNLIKEIRNFKNEI